MSKKRNLLLACALATVLAACQMTPPFSPTDPNGPTDPVDPDPTDPDPTGPELPDGRFWVPASFGTGDRPHSVAAADLDGDGLLDLVVAVSGDDAVAVLMGMSDRSFAAPVLLPVGDSPKHAVVADLDGDGALDIVVANDGAGSPLNVSVLLGNGDGTFAPSVAYASCDRPHQVAVGDVDGDGVPDVAVACWNDAEVAVLRGLGDGTFAPALGVGVGAGGAHAVVAGDLDGDGIDDLAVAVMDDSTVAILISTGTPGTIGFAPLVSRHGGSQPHDLAIADLDGDGHLDLVTANQGSDDLVVFLNHGDGVTFAHGSYEVGPAPKGVAIGDVDGDGILDLVAANSHGNYPDGETPTTITVWYGVGDGTFTDAETFEVSLTPFAAVVADLDDDGVADVVTANWSSDDVAVLYGTGRPRATELP